MRADAVALGVALGVSAAFAGATAAVALERPAAMDAVALYAGARLVVTGQGAALVDQDAVLAAERVAAPERAALLPFVQPPAVALLLAPFALLPYALAFPLMSALEALALLAAILLIVPRRAPLLLALLVLAPPSAVALAHAQTSPLELLLVALAIRSGPRASGLALGATLIRPQVAPLILLAGVLVPPRRAGTVVGAIVVVALSTAVVGVDGMGRYAATLVGAADWSISGEHGLRASIGWAGPAVALGLGGLGLAASIVSLAIGAVMVVRASPDARVRTASMWSLIAGPHLLLHDAVLAYPVLVPLVLRARPWAAFGTIAWVAHAGVVPIGIFASLAYALGARADAGTLRDPWR